MFICTVTSPKSSGEPRTCSSRMWVSSSLRSVPVPAPPCATAALLNSLIIARHFLGAGRVSSSGTSNTCEVSSLHHRRSASSSFPARSPPVSAPTEVPVTIEKRSSISRRARTRRSHIPPAAAPRQYHAVFSRKNPPSLLFDAFVSQSRLPAHGRVQTASLFVCGYYGTTANPFGFAFRKAAKTGFAVLAVA